MNDPKLGFCFGKIYWMVLYLVMLAGSLCVHASPNEAKDGIKFYFDGTEKKKYENIEVPNSVIQYCSKVLKGAPETWNTYGYSNFYGNDVFRYRDGEKSGNAVAFLIQGKCWIRLNSKESLPYINSALKDICHDFQNKDNKLSEYLHALSFMYKGYVALALTHRLYDQCKDIVDQNIWPGESLNGLMEFVGSDVKLPEMRKKYKILNSLCGETVTWQKNHFEMQVNMLTHRGGIDQWNIKGDLDNGIILTDVAVKQLYPEDTFYYDIMGEPAP